MKKAKKAEMGIGTLIIFIALILVAAVAAGVLIQTSSSLQSKALLTGEKSKDQVSTAVQAVSMSAEDGSDGNVTDFFVTVKTAPGSDPVPMADSLVGFDTTSSSDTYTYNNTATCSNVGGNDFAAEYLLGTKDGYIDSGDVIQICFGSGGVVDEGEDIKMSLTPQSGNRMVVETVTPQVMATKRVQIYPSN